MHSLPLQVCICMHTILFPLLITKTQFSVVRVPEKSRNFEWKDTLSHSLCKTAIKSVKGMLMHEKKFKRTFKVTKSQNFKF